MLGKVSPWKGCQALEDAPQGSGGVIIPGSIQKHADVVLGDVVDLAVLG